LRIIRGDGNCNAGASARVSLNALGAASAGTLSAVGGNSTVCAGSDAPTIELSGAAGQVLYWEKRRVGDLFWEKLTETSRLLTNGPLSFPTDFRVRTEAKPCSPVVSAAFRINVQQTPFPGILSTTQKRVCFKTPVVSVNLQGLSVPVQAWEVKDVNSGNTALFPTAATSWDVLEPTGSFQIRARLDGGLCGNVFSDWLGIEVLDSLRLQVQSQAPCGGTAGLQAQASGSMGGPYLYRIEPPIVPANLNGSFSPLTLGTYQVFVLDGNGCRNSQTITVTSTVVPPSILRFDFVSTNSALVMWTSVPGTGVRYELRYRIKGEQKWTVRAPLTQTAIFLNGLQHSAQYEVQIVVLCPDGKGGFDPTPSPDIKTFVTKSSGACLDTPPAVPGGVYLNPIEAHAVTVHWSPITDLRSFQGYIISFGLSDIHPNNWPQLVVCHPDTFIRIQGFIPRRNYGVRIRTNCSNCTTALQSADKRSAWSHTLDFSTPDFRESARSSVSTVEELKLYPNPTRGGFYVEVPCSSGTPIELQVYDLLGRLIKTDERDTNGGIMEYDFDLAAGVYRLQFRYCGSEAEQALIVY